MALLTTTAVLLRSYAYSETSQILRFYSMAHGVIGAMAKGVRKSGAKRGGPLATFSEGTLSLYFKESRDLQTFQDFAPTKTRRGLATDPVRLAGASVLAELILQHAESEGNPGLFDHLGAGLDAMDSGPVSTLIPALLGYLWGLIRDLGFEPSVYRCVECGRPFGEEQLGRFDFGAGGLRCLDCPGEAEGPKLGPRARSQLASLIGGTPPPDLLKPRTHLRLASDFVTYHLSGGSPLRSMAVLASLAPDSDA